LKPPQLNPLYRARKRENVVLLFISCLALAFGLFWLILDPRHALL